MKFVVAGNYEQYRNHINKMGYNPNEYVYVSNPMQLRGRVNLEGFYIGTWQDRSDIDEIKMIIAEIKGRSKATSHGGLGPSTIMLKQKGAWQSYDLKSNTVTTIPIVDDV